MTAFQDRGSWIFFFKIFVQAKTIWLVSCGCTASEVHSPSMVHAVGLWTGSWVYLCSDVRIKENDEDVSYRMCLTGCVLDMSQKLQTVWRGPTSFVVVTSFTSLIHSPAWQMERTGSCWSGVFFFLFEAFKTVFRNNILKIEEKIFFFIQIRILLKVCESVF